MVDGAVARTPTADSARRRSVAAARGFCVEHLGAAIGAGEQPLLEPENDALNTRDSTMTGSEARYRLMPQAFMTVSSLSCATTGRKSRGRSSSAAIGMT